MEIRVKIAQALGLSGFDILKGYSVRREYGKIRSMISGTRESIDLYQFNRVKALLIHAYESTGFYHKRMTEAAFDPYSFNAIEELKSLPVLTRSDLQSNWAEIISNRYNLHKLERGSSSGSTGTPVVFFQDKKALSSGIAANMVGWELSGWQLGYKGLHIWGNPTTVNEEWRKWGSKIKAVLFNHQKYPAYRLTAKNEFNVLADRLLKGRYDFIDGYTNAIFLLAEHLKENHLALNNKLRMVLTTAENLHDFQRRSIEENLGPVYDSYGCSEINAIAYECRFCGYYHIMEPHVIVELGDESVANSGSNLIITDLDNFAYPLIRYKNDDMGIALEGPEGRCQIELRQFERITGRQSDILRLPDGGTLSVPSFFGSMLLRKVEGIRQYQIVVEREDILSINLVKTAAFKEKDLEILKSSIDEYLNGKIGYEIKFVERIEASANGKYKLLIDRRVNQ